MRKNLTATMILLLSLGLFIGMIPMFVSTSTAAASSSQPTYFIEYSNAYATAVVNVPSIGNITRMTIAAIHQDKSSTIDNYEVLAIQLSSSLTTGTVSVTVSTNFNAEDLSWRKALRNGTASYTEINGTVTINNLLRVAANELRVVKTGNRVTVDFEPKTPVVATLPPGVFPPANFSATWTVPAFHMDLDVNGTFALGNSSSVTPSGWNEYNEYASSNANFTFSCPSWNNYRVSGSLGGTIRSFNVHRGQASGTPVYPTDPLKRVDFYNGVGQATVNIPKTGNITQMAIQVLHADQGTMGANADFLIMTLSATGVSGSVQVRINNSPSSLDWIKGVVNGTSAYTEVNGNVIINNVFQVSASELKVRRNGTRVTADFNPVTPINAMLPPEVFPRANFSATWAVPAFHMEFDIPNKNQSIVGITTVSNPSGWKTTNDYLLYFANSTITIPSWNFTTTTAGTNTFEFPYLVAVFRSPYAPQQPAASAFCDVTLIGGGTWYFFAHSNKGVGAHTYQWYEGTTLLQGQTSMVLTVTKTVPGTYMFYCKVIDAEGTAANSNTVTLTVAV